MNTLTRWLAVSLVLCCGLVKAQRPTIYTDDLLRDAARKGSYVVSNYVVSSATSENRNYVSIIDHPPRGFLKIDSLIFRNCTLNHVVIDSVQVGKIVLEECTGTYLSFSKVRIDELEVSSSKIDELEVYQSEITDSVTSHFGRFWVRDDSNVEFVRIRFASADDLTLPGTVQTTLEHCELGMIWTDGGSLKVSDSKVGYGWLAGEMSALDVERTEFRELFFDDVSVSGIVKVIESQFSRGLSINNLAAPTENIEIPFEQLVGGKLIAVLTRVQFDPSFGGMFQDQHSMTRDTMVVVNLRVKSGYSPRDSVYFQSTLFDKLVYNYQRFYNSYKARGDIESANACYVELKDLEHARLRFRHESDPSFKSFFRLRLSSVLKIYTDHGTDPAKAIVASVWVVFAFAIFYFFFPSDWDVSSKGRLLRQYRDFVGNNEKGYFIPFLQLVVGFLLSFANALTLSLNSFTTLGFGNIPTHGIARYVCVLQGFIGWFLLSIFTVALINQALF